MADPPKKAKKKPKKPQKVTLPKYKKNIKSGPEIIKGKAASSTRRSPAGNTHVTTTTFTKGRAVIRIVVKHPHVPLDEKGKGYFVPQYHIHDGTGTAVMRQVKGMVIFENFYVYHGYGGPLRPPPGSGKKRESRAMLPSPVFVETPDGEMVADVASWPLEEYELGLADAANKLL